MNPNVIRKLNEQAASLNPFEQPAPIVLASDKQNQTIKTEEAQPITIEEKKDNAFDLPEASESIEEGTTAFDLSKENTVVAAEKKEAPVINLKSEVAIAETKETVKSEIIKAPATSAVQPIKKTGKMYYVIGGCFGVFENAEKFRDQLIQEGFQAAIIGQNERGLHMVSLFSSGDMQRTTAELALIKEKAEANAWLFRK